MPELSFLDPGRLWFLLVVPALVVLYIWATLRKNRFGMRFTNTSVLARVVARQSQWRRHLAVALSLVSLVTLVLAWARPNGVERVPRERATIVLVVDVSRSMAATDVQPNRLDAAKQRSIEFLGQLPVKYNVSVVSMSGNPAVRVPPTTDRGMVQRAVQALEYQDSTAIGDALVTAVGAIQMAPKGDDGSVAPGSIVMLSDGKNTAGRSPLQGADEARKAKIPVFTIAYGTENGSVDLDGKRERVPPDRELLAGIAAATGGKTWSAESASDLTRVYSDLQSTVGFEEVKKETTAVWAGYGLAFAVLAALAAVSLGARWPS